MANIDRIKQIQQESGGLTGKALLEKRKREQELAASGQRLQQTGTSATSDGRTFLTPTGTGTDVKAIQPADQQQISPTREQDDIQTAPRQEPTIATAEAPVKTITPTGTSEFAGLDDRSKQVNILRKQADGIPLSQEEKEWKINRFLDQQEVTPDSLGLSDIGDTITGQIEGLEGQLTAQESELKTDREKAIEDKQRELDALLGQRTTDLREAGERERSAAQTALSFSGFGRSTFNAERQADIQKNVEGSVQAAKAAADLELKMFTRELEGADAESLQGFRDQISGLRQQAREFEVSSAMAVAEMNQQNKLGFEESFSNMLQTLEPSTQRAFDKDASAALGYASDEFGNALFTDENGEPVPLPKENEIEWGSTTDMFGNTIFYDKSNPANTMSPGGNTVYQNTSGEISSSPTSNVDGVQSFGQGDEYTRDDGSTGTLGENCVKWAREQVPNLPFGLFNKQDKINAINLAEQDGFGSRNMDAVQVGDAILTGEGNVGHAAVVADIDPQTGDLILAEANYTPGQVTGGRRISRNDPKIYGFINPTSQFGQKSTVVNEDALNEGANPAIATQVVVQASDEVREFTEADDAVFEKWIKDGQQPNKLPAQFKSPSGYQQFQQDFAQWSSQKGAEGAIDSPAAERARDKNRVAIETIDSILGGGFKAAGKSGLIFPDMQIGVQDLKADLDTIISSIALDEMKRLKESSPTGSTGFGALSEKELNILTSGLGSLRPNMSEKKLVENLERIRGILQKANSVDTGSQATTGGTVKMIAPDGGELSVPQDQVESMKAAGATLAN